jgi:hypothetical protein
VLLINSLKFASLAATANKTNNVWQLSRLNDSPERYGCGILQPGSSNHVA